MSAQSQHQDKKAQAAKLKEAGNVLYGQQKYTEAAEKYTAAIELDNKNAIYFTNRATCRYYLKKYMEALVDAEKATKIEPTYVKAWARLAQSQQQLAMYIKAKKSWEEAHSLLPPKDLTDSDRRLRVQIIAGLREMTAKLRELENPNMSHSNIEQTSSFGIAADLDTPWGRARGMLPELTLTSNTSSSAWLILGAYEEWTEAVKSIRQAPVDAKQSLDLAALLSGPRLQASKSAIVHFANALLRTTRVFHMSLNEPKLLEKVQSQMIIDLAQTRSTSWPPMGADAIIADAERRIPHEGWSAVGSALAVLVCCRVIRGFLNYIGSDDYAAAFRWYTMAVDTIELGQKLWKNVPRECLGPVFEATFLRGLKVLRINAYAAAYRSQKSGDATFTLHVLKALAEELYAETEADPRPLISNGHEAGSVMPFRDCPLAVSLATKAYCLKASSRLSTKKSLNSEDKAAFLEAASLYIRAAEKVPKDDEVHTMYLYYALTCYWDARESLATVLPLLKRLCHALPTVNRIWDVTTNAQGVGKGYDHCKAFLSRQEHDLEKRKVKLSTVVCPAFEYH